LHRHALVLVVSSRPGPCSRASSSQPRGPGLAWLPQAALAAAWQQGPPWYHQHLCLVCCLVVLQPAPLVGRHTHRPPPPRCLQWHQRGCTPLQQQQEVVARLLGVQVKVVLLMVVGLVGGV
jgi:hypothetical protein